MDTNVTMKYHSQKTVFLPAKREKNRLTALVVYARHIQVCTWKSLMRLLWKLTVEKQGPGLTSVTVNVDEGVAL